MNIPSYLWDSKIKIKNMFFPNFKKHIFLKINYRKLKNEVINWKLHMWKTS